MSKKSIRCAVLGVLLWWSAAVLGMTIPTIPSPVLPLPQSMYYPTTHHVLVEDLISPGRGTGSAHLLADAAVAAGADQSKALQS